MPVHFKLLGGSLISGHLNGMAEMYICDDDGNGEIYIGNFLKNKLNDPDGTYIVYSNTTYTSYNGTFIDNHMDGHINVITVEFLNQETEDEKKYTGNSMCGTTGRKYISNSELQLPVSGNKKIVIYSNGIRGSVLSEKDVQVTFNVMQVKLNNRNIFCKLTASLVN